MLRYPDDDDYERYVVLAFRRYVFPVKNNQHMIFLLAIVQCIV